jgi:Fe-S oxidoreductase
MMSMKEEGKPISFVEDCAVPLMCLADYTQRLTEVFERHGTRGTWYAHASVGCLHVRPVLNLRQEKDVKAMRAIAEEAFAMVRDYKGSHSGEHGDGIVRSEFHEFMFGKRLVMAFEEVKDKFDPKGLLNPGKIVRAPKFDDREKFRYAPGYAGQEMKTQLDWSAWPGAGGGFQGAVEMCNNNGACRKAEGGVMCPSWRVTQNERDVTRGRANSLRLAITGQLGPDALTSDEMAETMKLCVSCKACRRECPTGVDMARMKIEVLSARAARHGLSLRDRLIGWMPRYAPYAARMPGLFNARDKYPRLKQWSERLAGLSTRRTLPQWRKDVFDDTLTSLPHLPGRVGESANDNEPREVVLLADTFNRYFERENLDAAVTVLRAAGYTVHAAKPADGSKRPLCCGRTFLSVGRVDQAKREAERVIAAVAPFVARGVPVIGLEPSCILGFRDEVPAMIKSEGAEQLSLHALMFEEFLVREAAAGRLDLPLKPVAKRALIHGHCHQKAFGMFSAVQRILKLIPDLEVETVESSCCGMAGAFGYGADTIDVSMAMGELSLLPAVRKAEAETLIVADGTSCRHQIHDGASREALHVARVLAMSVQMANAAAFEGEGG